MKILDSNFWIIFTLLIALSGLALWRGGTPFLGEALGGGMKLFLRFGLLLFVSFLVAGLAEALMPREWVQSTLGPESGWKGLLIATAAGAITPAGPFVSMPLAAGMLRAAAGAAAVITFVSAWGLLAIHRLIAWEIPILGAGFAISRWMLCLVLPPIVGLLARALLRS